MISYAQLNEEQAFRIKSEEIIWQILLHYESNLFGETKGRIKSENFYLAEDGSTNALNELRHTILQFDLRPDVQCIFPARAMFIRKHFPEIQLKQVVCEEFVKFKQHLSTQGLSLIYATGYMGNPASMFGHLFLHFEQSRYHHLLDNTLSYGVEEAESDNKLFYVLNGLLGGYEGRFTHQKFHHQTHAYQESELRDLWQYKLKTDEVDLSLLIAHLWELQRTTKTYYFIRQNCAYQMAHLLRLVFPDAFAFHQSIWVLPFDVLTQITGYQEGALIENITYHESRHEKLLRRYPQLTTPEKTQLLSIIHDDSISPLQQLPERLSVPSTQKVIDTYYDYLAVREVQNDELTLLEQSKRTRALKTRFELPAYRTTWRKEDKQPPHLAQPSSGLRISNIYNETFGSGSRIQLRGNYYDLLNVNYARLPFSELNVMNLTLDYFHQNKKWQLHAFDLVNIKKLNPNHNEIFDEAEFSWEVKLGYGVRKLNCSSCQTGYSDNFIGNSHPFFEQSIFYYGLNGVIYTDKNIDDSDFNSKNHDYIRGC